MLDILIWVKILKVFPNPQIVGTQNVDVWFRYMTYSCKPIVRLFTGLMYYLKWKKDDNMPPFHGCFLKYVKGVNIKIGSKSSSYYPQNQNDWKSTIKCLEIVYQVGVE